jgi:hypothetical protein
MTPRGFGRSIATAMVVCFAILSTNKSIGAEPTQLYKAGMEAYGRLDYVDALKYLFAYQVIAEKSLEGDVKGKKALEEAISYSESKLRESANFAMQRAATSRGWKIEGVLSPANPWMDLGSSALEKTLKANTREKSQ